VLPFGVPSSPSMPCCNLAPPRPGSPEHRTRHGCVAASARPSARAHAPVGHHAHEHALWPRPRLHPALHCHHRCRAMATATPRCRGHAHTPRHAHPEHAPVLAKRPCFSLASPGVHDCQVPPVPGPGLCPAFRPWTRR
jgi:hypothetical protein